MIPAEEFVLRRAGAILLDQWRRYQLEGVFVLAIGLVFLVLGVFVTGIFLLLAVIAIIIGGWGYVYYSWRLHEIQRLPVPAMYPPPLLPPPPGD